MKKFTLLVGLLVGFVDISMAQYYPEDIQGGRVLDSIVSTTETNIEKFYFDENGNQTKKLTQYWDDKAGWVNETLEESDYSKNPIVTINSVWNTEKEVWENAGKYETTLDANKHMTEYLEAIWDNGAWKNFSKNVYSYNAQGLETENIAYNWDDEKNKWLTIDKSQFTYDSKGNQTEILMYVWEESTQVWKNYSHRVNTYDANNNRTLEMHYTWDGSQWVNNWKEEYAYDANNNETMNAYYGWNESTSSWVGYSKAEYTKDAYGYRLTETRYNWDNANAVWYVVGEYKSELKYYNDLLISEEIGYSKDKEYGWIKTYKYENTYNERDNIATTAYSTWSLEKSAWEMQNHTEISYDQYGNMEKVQYFNSEDVVSSTTEWFFSGGQQAISNVQSDKGQCTKVMENGVLYIMYKGTKYNVQGGKVVGR